MSCGGSLCIALYFRPMIDRTSQLFENLFLLERQLFCIHAVGVALLKPVQRAYI